MRRPLRNSTRLEPIVLRTLPGAPAEQLPIAQNPTGSVASGGFAGTNL